MKDALRARASGPNWVADLPWILLGLWAQPQEDTGRSAAEAVFIVPLVLPGQFMHQPDPPGQEFFDQLCQAMSNFQPAPVRHNTGERAAAPAELPPDLLQADFVFITKDGHLPALQQLYEGPFRGLSRSREMFKLQLGARSDNLSTSRLKAAWLPAGAKSADPFPTRSASSSCCCSEKNLFFY